MSEKITTTYLDPETGVESRANPKAIRMTYTDPNGVRRTGYSIDNRMYEDEAGTRRIGIGSIVSNAAGTKTWIMTANGGVDYAEYMAGLRSTDNTAPLTAAKDAALSAAQQRIDADVARIESERPQVTERYDELARQNYQGYLNDERALANGLAASGLYKSGYSDTERVRALNSYRERGNENERARLADIAELERRIDAARSAGSAELGELEAKYLQMIQNQQNVDRNYRYQLSRDEVADARYADELAYARNRDAVADARYADELAYDRNRDAVADARYADELAYSRNRDAVADARYADELAYSRNRDAVADARYADELAYDRNRDAVADARYADELAYSRNRDAVYDARYADELAYDRNRDAVYDARYADELAYDRSRDAVEDARFERSYADSRADVQFQREQALRSAATGEAQRAVDNAYLAAELGDFAPLRALGIDTTAAEKLFALEMQKLYQSVYGSGSGGTTATAPTKTTAKTTTATPTAAPAPAAAAATEEALPSYALRLMEDNPVLYEEILRMADGFASSQIASPLSAQEVAAGGLQTRVEQQLTGYRSYLTNRYGEDAYRLYRYTVLRQMPWNQTTAQEPAEAPVEEKKVRVYTADELYSTYASQIYDKVSTGVTDTDRYGRTTKDTVTTTKKNASEVSNVCRTIRRLYENGQIEAGEMALLLERLGITAEYAALRQ